MTSHTDNFRAALDTSVWLPVVTFTNGGTFATSPQSQINSGDSTVNGYAVAQQGGGPSANGNYLVHRGGTPSLPALTVSLASGVNNAGNYRFTCGAPLTGWSNGNILMIRVRGLTGGDTKFNGVWPAIVIDAAAGIVEVAGITSTTSPDTFSGGFVDTCAPAGNESPDSIQSANVMSSAQGTDNYVILWSRLAVGAGPSTELKRGYGLRLWWKSATERVLEILRVDPLTGLTGVKVVASKSTNLNLLQYDGSDLSVTQRLVLIVTDNDPGIGDDAQGILIRGYLNRNAGPSGEVDLAKPDVEFIDRGSGSAPVFHENGLWAITFGAQDQIFLDSWSGADGFVWPKTGVGRAPQYQTLAELRAGVRTILGRGPTTNTNVAALDTAINDAQTELLNMLGDNATFMRRTETITLESVGDELWRVPGHVERLLFLWETANLEPVRWRFVDRDENGDLLIAKYNTSTEMRAQYERVAQAMVSASDYCAIPRRYDECLRYMAALRIVERMRDPKGIEVISRRVATLFEQMQRHLYTDQRMEDPVLEVDIPDVDDWRNSADYLKYPIY